MFTSYGEIPYISEVKEYGVAEAQAKVGIFFTLKARLLKLRREQPDKRARVEEVLNNQIKAEPIVQRAVGVISAMEEQGANAIGLLQIAPAITLIVKQIKDTERLESGSTGFDWKGLPFKWIGGGVLGVWALKKFI